MLNDEQLKFWKRRLADGWRLGLAESEQLIDEVLMLRAKLTREKTARREATLELGKRWVDARDDATRCTDALDKVQRHHRSRFPWHGAERRCKVWRLGPFLTDWRCLLPRDHEKVEGHPHIFEPDLWPGGRFRSQWLGTRNPFLERDA